MYAKIDLKNDIFDYLRIALLLYSTIIIRQQLIYYKFIVENSNSKIIFYVT